VATKHTFNHVWEIQRNKWAHSQYVDTINVGVDSSANASVFNSKSTLFESRPEHQTLRFSVFSTVYVNDGILTKHPVTTASFHMDVIAGRRLYTLPNCRVSWSQARNFHTCGPSLLLFHLNHCEISTTRPALYAENKNRIRNESWHLGMQIPQPSNKS
jgi:hypothetical protein